MIFSKNKQIDSKKRPSAILAFGVVLVLNGLAGSTKILGGVNTAEVSDNNPTLFTPSGVTFAIWGIIYLLLIGFCLYIYGVGVKKRSISAEKINLILKWFTISSILNSLWILAWQYQILWLSVLLIFCLLYSLTKIADVTRSVHPQKLEYVMAKLPFSIYFGWITVASIANVSVWLVSIGWDGLGVREGIWTVGILLVAAAIGLVASIRNNDVAYLLVFVWGFCGILLKHLAPSGHNGAYPSIIITLTILLAILLSFALQMIRPTIEKWLSSNDHRL
jgi:hypothetical protein